MTENEFESIVAASRTVTDPQRGKSNLSRQAEKLESLLAALPAEDVLDFVRLSKLRMIAAYRWDLWAAAYILRGGCSDDSFSDFRSWLISMGDAVYKNALADVESLAEVAFRPGVEDTAFEEFDYIPRKVYRDKTGAGVPDFGIPYPDAPVGEPWQEDDCYLQRRFPKLWAARVSNGTKASIDPH